LKTSPVFQEELNMLSDVTGYPLGDFGSLNLWTANRYYYLKGQKIFKLIGGNMFEPPKIQWLKDEKRIFKEIKAAELRTEDEIKNTIKKANRFILGTIEERAIHFIRETKESLRDKIIWTAVSFSGGKDSATVSHLVRKALGNGVIHIFSDTTIEHPSTYDFLDRYHESEKIYLVRAKPEKDFMTMVHRAQMPSRIHRWCCSVVKTAPIEGLLKMIVDNGKKVLTFDGVRHEESKRREGYNSVSYDT
jgi:phosphoadenosine phosphosulfate reductase